MSAAPAATEHARSIIRRAAWVYAALPVVFIALFIWHNALITPAYDEWGVVLPSVVNAFEGRFSLETISRAYNGHRLLIPNLISTGLALLTRWDVRAEVAFSFVLALVCCGCVLAIYRRSGLSRLLGIAWIALMALFFTPVQYINFVFGFQKCIWLIMTALYASAALGQHWGPRPRTWIAAALLTMMAAWSFLSGHLLWIVIPIGLYLLGERKWRRFAAWGAFAVLNIGIYLIGYTTRDGGLPPPDRSPFDGGGIVIYPLTFLGGPFSASPSPFVPVEAQNTTLALVVGIFGIVLLLAALIVGWQSRRADGERALDMKTAAPFLMLILFSLGSGALVALGRAVEPANAITSRYITLAIPFWIGLFGLIVHVASRAPSFDPRRGTLVFVCALLTPVLVVLFALTAYKFAFTSLPRDEMAQCMLTFDDPACSGVLMGIAAVNEDRETRIHERLASIRTLNLSLFAQPYLTDLRTPTLMNMTPGGSVTHEVFEIDGIVQPVLFMRPPVRVEQRIYVPTALATVRLETAIYVPPPQFIPQAGDPANIDGAGFALWIIDESGAETLATAAVYDPLTTTDPLPVTVDLTPYRGQIITLRYGTEGRDNADFDWAMWVAPTLRGN